MSSQITMPQTKKKSGLDLVQQGASVANTVSNLTGSDPAAKTATDPAGGGDAMQRRMGAMDATQPPDATQPAAQPNSALTRRYFAPWRGTP